MILLWTRVIAAARRSLWTSLVTFASYAIFASIYSSTLNAQSVGSDGAYTWLYTRSLVFDHDIDFKNDYALCGDFYHKGIDRGTGHVDNPFYVGPSIVWVPVLWAGKQLVRLPEDAPEDVKQACRGPLVTKTLAVGPLLGALTVLIMARLARRFGSDGVAALAAGLLGLCTTLPAYAAIMPSYSHIHDAFWAGLTMLASVRAVERPQSMARWALAGAAVGVGMLQRPVSVVFAVIPAALALRALWRQWGKLAASFASQGGATLIVGVVPQMLVYRYLYGAFIPETPHGRFYMHYGHAHPWLVLFAPHGGLFFTAPVTWLAVFGAVIGLTRSRSRVVTAATLAACAALVWISSAALDWDGSGTYGARRLTSLVPLLAIPTAIMIGRARRWLNARPQRALVMLGFAVLVPTAFTAVGQVKGTALERVSTERGLSQGQLYGVGRQVAWERVDDAIGDLAIYPAELVFAARYGLSPRAFRDATEPLYVRNYRTMEWERTVIGFKDEHRNLVTGAFVEQAGMRIAKRRATVVFAAQWPFATSVVVRASAVSPTHVRIGRGQVFGTQWFGDVAVDDTVGDASVTIPPGGFDSGIMELVIACDDLAANVVIESIKIDDMATYPSPL